MDENINPGWVNPGLAVDPDGNFEGMDTKKYETHKKRGGKAFTELQNLSLEDTGEGLEAYDEANRLLLRCAGRLPMEVRRLTAKDTKAGAKDMVNISVNRRSMGPITWNIAQAAQYWGVELKPTDRFQPTIEDGS